MPEKPKRKPVPAHITELIKASTVKPRVPVEKNWPPPQPAARPGKKENRLFSMNGMYAAFKVCAWNRACMHACMHAYGVWGRQVECACKRMHTCGSPSMLKRMMCRRAHYRT